MHCSKENRMRVQYFFVSLLLYLWPFDGIPLRHQTSEVESIVPRSYLLNEPKLLTPLYFFNIFNANYF